MIRASSVCSKLVAGGACLTALVFALSLQARPAVQASNASSSYASAQAHPGSQQAPGRVARLAYLSGQVQFAPNGENDWGSVEINRPMVPGDRLLTGGDGLAVLQLGDAAVRIDHGTAFDFLNLDADNVQLELSQGTLNLAVHRMGEGENFEVDTPTVAFVASTPGIYRIDDSPTGTGSMVTVFRGAGVVYGENGTSREVTAGTSYRFNDSTLTRVEVTGPPQPDAFDRFCRADDANYRRYAAQEQPYTAPSMIGGNELYRYGRWDDTPEYGNVWYPTTVPAGWAPYRYGHWAWIGPWGWTWVDDQPWGFAPFHYGRWVYLRNRWGWVPGPVNVRPVYAPALVAFVGGPGLSLSVHIGATPVGWFPLGPRDVYVPWFDASRRYFTRVNLTNIRNVYVNRSAIRHCYSDYRQHRFANIHRYNHYVYGHLPGAVTVVPRKVFVDARPVHPAVLQLDSTRLVRTRVVTHPGVNPGAVSLGVRRTPARATPLRHRTSFAHRVVMHRAPASRRVTFAAQEKTIAIQPDRPVTVLQMRGLHNTHAASQLRNQRARTVPRRLPVVSPLELASPSLRSRATRQQRQAEVRARQRQRSQQLQQQRQARAREQQRLRTQRLQQQGQALPPGGQRQSPLRRRVLAQQRAREQRLQRQRRTQQQSQARRDGRVNAARGARDQLMHQQQIVHRMRAQQAQQAQRRAARKRTLQPRREHHPPPSSSRRTPRRHERTPRRRIESNSGNARTR